MALEQHLGMVEGLGGPIDALQAQRQGVACGYVIRGECHGPLEQAHSLLEPALLLEARGHDV